VADLDGPYEGTRKDWMDRAYAAETKNEHLRAQIRQLHAVFVSVESDESEAAARAWLRSEIEGHFPEILRGVSRG